jgi:DNA-binding beta-propeller fold protein YncE
MTRRSRTIIASLVALAAVAVLVSVAAAGRSDRDGKPVSGAIWVANRGANTIRAFDATTGNVLTTIAMRAGSQPGDLAYARGKLYVAEEFGSPPAIAIVDAVTGMVLKRIFTGPRPHHVHVTRDGDLIAYGVFGSNKVGIIDTGSDMLLGEWPASTNPAARSHAGVFSADGNTVYVANEGVNELSALDPRTGELLWTMTVPAIHELIVSRHGKTAYVSCRSASELRVVDLKRQVITATIPLGPMPDTLQLSENEMELTVGLRGSPAQIAVVNTRTWTSEIVTIGGPGTIAGHQWTSPSGRLTFAAFEGPGAGVAVIDHRRGSLIQTLDYPGRPHGLVVVPTQEADD